MYDYGDPIKTMMMRSKELPKDDIMSKMEPLFKEAWGCW